MSAQIDSLDETGYAEEDRDFIMLLVNDLIWDIIKNDARFKPALINKVQVIVFTGFQDRYEEFKEATYFTALKIQKEIKAKLNIKISIGISRPFHDLACTQIAYKESIEALMSSIKFGEEVISHFEEVQPNGSIKQPYPKMIEDELIQAINRSEVERANRLLEGFIDSVLGKELSFSEYEVCFMRLLISIIGILQDSGESINILFDKQGRPFDELHMLRSPNQIKKWFTKSIIEPIVKTLEERRGSHYKNILNEVLNIIHSEYDKDISLEYCAERLNYNPSYLWRVLRKEMDITFSDYLAKYRLGIAKNWLEETDMSIGDMAMRLGYNNSQNFIRYFKKLEGITPGKYRDKFRKTSTVNQEKVNSL